MKKYTALSLTILSLVCFLHSNGYSGNSKKNGPASPLPPDYTNAVVVSPAEYDTLTARFRIKFPNAITLGGMMNKDSLQALISSLPARTTTLHFIFFTDAALKKEGVAIKGDNSTVKIYRNSTSNGFCPSSCDVNSNAEGVTELISYANYKDLHNLYKKANKSSTWGGTIDVAALSAILSSVPGSQKNISFRFCYDMEFQNSSTIFIGGTVGQSERNVLYLRNGGNAGSFCPTACDEN